MALTLVGTATSGFFRGVSQDESGINIEEISTAVKPEWKEFLMGKTNEKIGFCVPPAEAEVTIKGECSDPTDVPATNFSTAATIANTINYMGATSYDMFCDEATFVEARAGWFNYDGK